MRTGAGGLGGAGVAGGGLLQQGPGPRDGRGIPSAVGGGQGARPVVRPLLEGRTGRTRGQKDLDGPGLVDDGGRALGWHPDDVAVTERAASQRQAVHGCGVPAARVDDGTADLVAGDDGNGQAEEHDRAARSVPTAREQALPSAVVTCCQGT